MFLLFDMWTLHKYRFGFVGHEIFVIITSMLVVIFTSSLWILFLTKVTILLEGLMVFDIACVLVFKICFLQVYYLRLIFVNYQFKVFESAIEIDQVPLNDLQWHSLVDMFEIEKDGGVSLDRIDCKATRIGGSVSNFFITR